jgi:hypothetical protein
MDGKEESERMSKLEQALLAPGGFAKLLNAPRHRVSEDEYKMIRGAIDGLDRKTPGPGRQLMDPRCGALLAKSLLNQGVLPPGTDTSAISAGFDPDAPFPTHSGYNLAAREHMVHLFCGEAVVAFFLLDHVTGGVTEAYCVQGCLSDFDASFDADNDFKWGRVWVGCV